MSNPMQILSMFPRFMQMNQGKNPQQILNEMISSGQITQEQLNQAQKMAQQMSPQFEQFRQMFGFGKHPPMM